MDVAWMQIDSVISGGYVSDFGVVKFFSGRPLQLLRGPVTSLSYDSIHHLAAITFSGKGNFTVGPVDLTWVWTGEQDTDWHNQANWQLLNHPFIKGVPVATNNVIIPAGVSHIPHVSSGNTAVCHDLTILPDASLSIDTLKFLTVEGTLTIGASQQY